MLEKLDSLAIEEQRRVLGFTSTLAEGKAIGIAGRELPRFAGTIDKTELEIMTRTIEDRCERVDLNDW